MRQGGKGRGKKTDCNYWLTKDGNLHEPSGQQADEQGQYAGNEQHKSQGSSQAEIICQPAGQKSHGQGQYSGKGDQGIGLGLEHAVFVDQVKGQHGIHPQGSGHAQAEQ